MYPPYVGCNKAAVHSSFFIIQSLHMLNTASMHKVTLVCADNIYPLYGILHLLNTNIRNESRFHLLLIHGVPVDGGEVWRRLHIRQAGEPMLWVHCQQLEGTKTHTHIHTRCH